MSISIYMVSRVLGVTVIALVSFAALQASDIEGSVIIKRKLTKRRVTAPNAYSRGVTVEVHADPAVDPLVFERTRVVVYLEGDLPSKPLIVTMEQLNQRFVPDTLVIPAGSTVSFPNLDPIFHNVFSLSKAKSFDLGNYPKDHTRTVTFPKPGIVFVDCHLHPNMAAAIVVSPNQWSAKPDAGGRFTLPDVPPGRYTIVAWHRAAGFFRQTIEVKADAKASVQFAIPLEENGTKIVAER